MPLVPVPGSAWSPSNFNVILESASATRVNLSTSPKGMLERTVCYLTPLWVRILLAMINGLGVVGWGVGGIEGG